MDRPVGSQFGDADRGGGATNGAVKMRAPHSDANETAAFKLQCICLTALARSVTVPVRENLDIEVTASELAASRYVARIRVGDLIGEHCRICRGFKHANQRCCGRFPEIPWTKSHSCKRFQQRHECRYPGGCSQRKGRKPWHYLFGGFTCGYRHPHPAEARRPGDAGAAAQRISRERRGRRGGGTWRGSAGQHGRRVSYRFIMPFLSSCCRWRVIWRNANSKNGLPQGARCGGGILRRKAAATK